MKYKLIQAKTGEEHLCDKVTIDGFDYYMSDEKINEETLFVDDNKLFECRNIFEIGIEDDNGLIHKFENCKKIIATNNPNIDIPKVVDEVEKLAFDYYEQVKKDYYSNGQQAQMPKSNKEFQAMGDGFIEGYNKSQETHPFSEEDMKDFGYFCAKHYKEKVLPKKSFDELLQLWKEEKIKIIFYERNNINGI